jgi:hypothetical protein
MQLCSLVEFSLQQNWLQKTFPFLLRVRIGERTVGGQKTFIIVQYSEQQGREIKAEGWRKAAAVSLKPATVLAGGGSTQVEQNLRVHHLLDLAAPCE